jgi:hypothetical protein
MIVRLFLAALILLFPAAAMAQGGNCTFSEPDCAIKVLEAEAAKIEKVSWRDQIYRELAKLLAAEGRTDEAIAVIPRIETPDTQAMSIRGIGMAAAELDWEPARYTDLFKALRVEADKIEHPPSYAIALTYIAMGQAFAGDNEGAWATAADMENDALRHKAYGETAEIQAENQDAAAAMKSIGFIESEAYRNKAYSTVSKIFANDEDFAAAFDAAMPINNAYKKAQAIEYLLNKQRHLKLKQNIKDKE